MKDSHFYKRLDDQTGFKALVNMLKNQPLNIAEQVFENITTEAEDHPKYEQIKQVWEQRLEQS